jgi:hypothetical protein
VAPISGINLPDTIKSGQIQVFPAFQQKISAQCQQQRDRNADATPLRSIDRL